MYHTGKSITIRVAPSAACCQQHSEHFHRRCRPPPPLRPGGRPGAPRCHETAGGTCRPDRPTRSALRAFSTAAAAQILVNAGNGVYGAPRSHVTRPPPAASMPPHRLAGRTGRRAVRLAAGPSRRQRGRPPAASRGSARRHCDREITLTADRLCLCLCLRH